MNLHFKIFLFSLFGFSIGSHGFSQTDTTVTPGKVDTFLVNQLLEKSKEKLNNDPTYAINIAAKAKVFADQIKFPPGAAYALKNIGIAYYLQGNFLQSIEVYKQALAIFDSLNNKKGSANILNNIGAIYYDTGDDTLALSYHLRSLKLSEEIGDKLRIATSLGNIGGVYSHNKNAAKKALEYHQRSLALSKEIKDNYLIGIATANIGEIYMSMNFDDSALIYFKESLIAQKGTEEVSYTLNNIGKLYSKNKKFELALQMHRQAFDTAESVSNRLDMAKSLIALAGTYYQLQDFKKATIYYEQAKSLAIGIGAKNEIKDTYEGLAKTNASLGNYNSAFSYEVLFSAIKDTLYNIETNSKLSGLQFEFDLQKKENQINSLTHEQTLADNRLKKERLFRYALFIGLGLIFIIAFTQWRYNTHRKKANQLLQSQKDETELQKEKAEKALEELKAAEAQLIQSEKMASLGELTAGIAHEIQNPLNFVNNFSEINKEMLVELNEEIEKGNYDDARAIAKDVIENEEKINRHGKRADAIVKGMLQHSQSSTGVKEPTNLNALADEYLRLAYHGLKAKDNSFSASLKTGFDKSIGNINIIPQDIGRVLLNLYNNAFYAITEKKKGAANQYEPIISVSTKKLNDKIEISIKDNGNGIPQKVLDKIFQPFFTTKPTGQGTGLGLSLAYDIIKAHSGQIKVDTTEGEFAEFVIQLPITV